MSPQNQKNMHIQLIELYFGREQKKQCSLIPELRLGIQGEVSQIRGEIREFEMVTPLRMAMFTTEKTLPAGSDERKQSGAG